MKTITLSEAIANACNPSAITEDDVGKIAILVDGEVCDLASPDEPDPIAAYRLRTGPVGEGEQEPVIALAEIVSDAL